MSKELAKLNLSGAPRMPSMRIGGPTVFGFLVFIGFFVGLGSWAAFAPLDSGAIAPGFVVVEGNRKQVQHLEGGIIAKILVKEGMLVSAGDPLVYLDDTQAKVTLQQLQAQLRASLALEARLITERDDLPDVVYADELINDVESVGAFEILQGERRIFLARKEAVESQTQILKQRTVQIKAEIGGLRGEVRALDKQLALVKEELTAVADLVRRGFERRPRLLAIQRQVAQLEGTRAQNVAGIARARQSIGENELRAIDFRVQILNDAVQKLREEQTRIADLRERIRSAEDILQRTLITAPASGRVVDLKIYTNRGVITPREPLMDIVPQDQALIISAQVSLTDIDVVRAGLPVQLRFSALNQRSTPTLTGEVITISADKLTDERTGDPYFEARISVDAERAAKEDIVLTPGMPVEAMIVTGERTPIEYLTKPILASINRALRED